MREDEETRAELHQRVDDLRERLWNICDERKEKAENERSDIINDGWLEDRLGILSNHYITLMQVSLAEILIVFFFYLFLPLDIGCSYIQKIIKMKLHY